LSTKEERTLDQTWTLLEEKLEGLTTRYKDVASENARLKAAVVELSAERDRLKREVADAREMLGKTSRYEAEREEVRGRVERLLKSLEAAESAPADA
jgi:septal ring factor EnvC (AmiA/AmiB activator)